MLRYRLSDVAQVRFEPALLVVGRVLHDAMELAQHLDPHTSWE